MFAAPFARLFASLRWRLYLWQVNAEQRSAGVTAESHRAAAAYEGKLRTLLRGTPYWAEGHVLLAEHLLGANDAEGAFASAQAAIILTPAEALLLRARVVISRCYLKYGESGKARELLEPLVARHPESWALREDLGAALLADGDFAGAARVLESIPSDRRSAEAGAALLYSRKRMSGDQS